MTQASASRLRHRGPLCGFLVPLRPLQVSAHPWGTHWHAHSSVLEALAQGKERKSIEVMSPSLALEPRSPG